MTRKPLTAIAVAAAALFLTGCTATVSAAEPATTMQAPIQATAPGSALPADQGGSTIDARALLSTLPVKGKAPKTGYDRVGDFGPAWELPGQACSTRDLILARDLTDVVKDGCKVLSGTLHDPYTGKTISFRRGVNTSAAVQIDHRVPLASSWQTGAQQLTATQRQQLANDPLNLVAVDGPTNGQKSDGDAATWLPPVKAYRCEYVAAQVAVKAKYRLWVAPAEHDAIDRILAGCAAVMVPRPTGTPDVAAPGETGTTPAPVPSEPAPTSAPAPEQPAATAPAAPAGTITPGALCSQQGAVGTSAAGKTYTCGKTPAADGRWHWNK